jgi:hypothetical protein
MISRLAAGLGILCLVGAACAETVSVPGKANLWLAGMTNGSTARRGDSAPAESPVLIATTPIEGGAVYTFSASGSANHGAPNPFFPPDGEDLISHYLGAENGVADITAPFVSLLGVFLGPDQPDQTPAPQPLDFRNPTDRDYLGLAPALKQPFFIGDGLTSSGAVQQVIAPIGATRLFLGVMDQYAWYDNQGAFEVRIMQVASRSKVRLSLHPALNPTSADAVASTAATNATPKGVPPINATTTASAPLNSPGPELHAVTAIELFWPSESNQRYQVQWTPSLNPASWANLGPALSGTGGNMSVFDSTRTHPQAFYRVRIVQ